MAYIPGLHINIMHFYVHIGSLKQSSIFANILLFILVSSKCSILMKKVRFKFCGQLWNTLWTRFPVGTTITHRQQWETEQWQTKRGGFTKAFSCWFFIHIHTVLLHRPYLICTWEDWNLQGISKILLNAILFRYCRHSLGTTIYQAAASKKRVFTRAFRYCLSIRIHTAPLRRPYLAWTWLYRTFQPGSEDIIELSFLLIFLLISGNDEIPISSVLKIDNLQ